MCELRSLAEDRTQRGSKCLRRLAERRFLSRVQQHPQGDRTAEGQEDAQQHRGKNERTHDPSLIQPLRPAMSLVLLSERLASRRRLLSYSEASGSSDCSDVAGLPRSTREADMP